MVRLTKSTTPVQLEQAINNIVLANPGIVQNTTELLLASDNCLGADILDADLSTTFAFEHVLTKADTPVTHPLYTMMGRIRVKQVTGEGFLVGNSNGTPFYLLLYMSEQNDLRAYIPTQGNAINPYTNELFGENQPQDDAIAQRLGHKSYADMDYSLPGIQDQFYDKTMLLHDILSNIHLKH